MHFPGISLILRPGKWGAGDCLFVEALVGLANGRRFLKSNDIGQRDSTRTWNGGKIVLKCRFPLWPFTFIFELAGVGGLANGIRLFHLYLADVSSIRRSGKCRSKVVPVADELKYGGILSNASKVLYPMHQSN